MANRPPDPDDDDPDDDDPGDHDPGDDLVEEVPDAKPAADAKPKRSWKRIAIEVGVIALIFLGVRAWQSRDAASGPAPALRQATLAGPTFDLAAADSPVLVHFWATWCGVCQAEEGTIDGLAEDHRVITIASQSGTPESVQRYLTSHELGFDVINDPAGRLAHAWGVRAFPSSFVVADGQIRHVEVGYTTSAGFRARLWLASIL